MTRDVPHHILPSAETRHRPAVEHAPVAGIQHLDPLAPAVAAVPIQAVQCHLVRVPIGDIHANRVRNPGVPGGRDPVRARVRLQGARIASGSGPGKGCASSIFSLKDEPEGGWEAFGR